MHKVLKILILSSIFYNLAAGSLGPIYAIFVTEIGGGIFVASSAWSIYAALVGILILVFGRFEDKLNKKSVFIVGRLVNTIGIAGYLFVSSPLELFIVQGILGIATAMMNPTFEAMYSRGLRRGHEASEWSVWEGSIYIVFALAAVVGGAIASVSGFKTLFLFMTAASFVSLITSTLLLRKGLWEQLRRARLGIKKP